MYKEVWENDEFYYLIQAPQIFSLIPKSALENDSAKQNFELTITSDFTLKSGTSKMG